MARWEPETQIRYAQCHESSGDGDRGLTLTT